MRCGNLLQSLESLASVSTPCMACTCESHGQVSPSPRFSNARAVAWLALANRAAGFAKGRAPLSREPLCSGYLVCKLSTRAFATRRPSQAADMIPPA